MSTYAGLICYYMNMKKFAVFDIDGTLIRWQLFHVLVDRLAKQGALGKGTAAQFKEARMRWKRREDSEAFREYEILLVNAFEDALGSISPAELDSLIHEIITEYKDQTYRYTRELIKSLQKKDYMLIAISGSHQELVAEVAKYYGFNDYVGSHYERRGDSFTGKKMIASHHKKQLLNELIKKHNLDLKDSIAIGDSKSDADMLEMVKNPIAFNPDKNLFEIAKTHGWNIVIERKNMIYQLTKSGNSYVLAQTD